MAKTKPKPAGNRKELAKALTTKPLEGQFTKEQTLKYVDKAAKHFKTKPGVILSEAIRRRGLWRGKNLKNLYFDLKERWGTSKEWEKDKQRIFKKYEKKWKKGKLKLLNM